MIPPRAQVAANYYEKLPAYMQDIFRLTHRAAKEDEEDVAKQAIEFWCTVCEEELDIQQVSARPARCMGVTIPYIAGRSGAPSARRSSTSSRCPHALLVEWGFTGCSW